MLDCGENLLSGVGNLLVFAPVHNPEILAPTSNKPFNHLVFPKDIHPKGDHLEGYIIVQRKRVSFDQTDVVSPVSVVVAVTPEKHPEVTAFDGPGVDLFGDPHFGFDGADTGH